MLSALFLLAFGALAAIAGYVAPRYLALRAFGIRDARLAFGVTTRWEYPAAPRSGPAVMVGAGIVGIYLVAVAFGITGAFSDGVESSDEQSMAVRLNPGGPAAEAGVLDGDRILSIDGVAVHSWDELRAGVKAHAHDEVTLGVERDGAPRTIAVPLPHGPDARLQVGAPTARRPIGAGTAIARGLALPFRIATETVRGLVRGVLGREHVDVSGPVGIVKATKQSTVHGVTGGLSLVAVLLSYIAWPVIVFALVTFPRRAANPSIRNP